MRVHLAATLSPLAIACAFIATAAAEKLSALMTVDYLEERAARGDRARFDRVLGKVRDVPAEEDDLPSPNVD
jgi:hypothetical protein